MVEEYYTGAIPVWFNKNREQVYKVFFEYRGDRFMGGCWQVMTATGSLEVAC